MTDKNRESFIFYSSFHEAIKIIPDKERLKIYDAITDYAINSNVPELNGLCLSIFTLIRPQLDANIRRRENGNKGKDFGAMGGRPKKPQDNPKETPSEPQDNPKETPNVNANVNVNVNANVNGNYLFNGNVLRLNKKDYDAKKSGFADRMTEEQFHKELLKIDEYYTINPCKNVFIAMNNWLQKANERLPIPEKKLSKQEAIDKENSQRMQYYISAGYPEEEARVKVYGKV